MAAAPKDSTGRPSRPPDKLVRDVRKRAGRALATYTEPGAFVRIHARDLKAICEYAIDNGQKNE